jgi:hypothetical protein
MHCSHATAANRSSSGPLEFATLAAKWIGVQMPAEYKSPGHSSTISGSSCRTIGGK